MASRYEVIRIDDGIENHLLVDHQANARVALAPARGGMVTRFRVGNTNVLYLDPATLYDPTRNVRGGIPVLFPIAGRLRDDVFVDEDGHRYPMRQHGFARDLPWVIADQSTADGARIVLELGATDATRAQFPFDFRVTFSYQLADGRLSIAQRFANLSARDMPIHPGLHPYFQVADWRKPDARVVTDARTAWDNRAGRTVTLRGPIELATDEIDLHLFDHWPRTVRLVRPNDRALELTLGVPDRVLVIWTLRGRDFVCVEPWTAPANAINEGKAVRVPPGGAHETSFAIAALP